MFVVISKNDFMFCYCECSDAVNLCAHSNFRSKDDVVFARRRKKCFLVFIMISLIKIKKAFFVPHSLIPVAWRDPGTPGVHLLLEEGFELLQRGGGHGRQHERERAEWDGEILSWVIPNR